MNISKTVNVNGISLILAENFERKWEDLFEEQYSKHIICTNCDVSEQLCSIHEQEYKKMTYEFKKERMANISLYGCSVCDHYFRTWLELIIHNFTCPILYKARLKNGSCIKCKLFHWTGNFWFCVKCGYQLDYKMLGKI